MSSIFQLVTSNVDFDGDVMSIYPPSFIDPYKNSYIDGIYSSLNKDECFEYNLKFLYEKDEENFIKIFNKLINDDLFDLNNLNIMFQIFKKKHDFLNCIYFDVLLYVKKQQMEYGVISVRQKIEEIGFRIFT